MTGGATGDRSSLARMLAIFDVTDDGTGRFTGGSDGGERRVVDGSQYLAQAVVAASKRLPRHRVRSAHAVFTRAVDDERPIWFDVDVVHEGRTVAAAVVTVGQDDRRCATVSILADTVEADVIRHAAPIPDVAGPNDARPYAMPMEGRLLRLVDVADPNDPDEVGPPVLDAWLHYDQVPDRPDLARALIAHFTGHLAISATMRGHAGVGTSQAHRTLSTAVMTITITFHDPVTWVGWLLYHHVSTQVGGGMSYVRGQVFTDRGVLVASFVQEGMIRPFGDEAAAGALPVEARL